MGGEAASTGGGLRTTAAAGAATRLAAVVAAAAAGAAARLAARAAATGAGEASCLTAAGDDATAGPLQAAADTGMAAEGADLATAGAGLAADEGVRGSSATERVLPPGNCTDGRTEAGREAAATCASTAEPWLPPTSERGRADTTSASTAEPWPTPASESGRAGSSGLGTALAPRPRISHRSCTCCPACRPRAVATAAARSATVGDRAVGTSTVSRIRPAGQSTRTRSSGIVGGASAAASSLELQHTSAWQSGLSHGGASRASRQDPQNCFPRPSQNSQFSSLRRLPSSVATPQTSHTHADDRAAAGAAAVTFVGWHATVACEPVRSIVEQLRLQTREDTATRPARDKRELPTLHAEAAPAERSRDMRP